jgi:hypothetical protein
VRLSRLILLSFWPVLCSALMHLLATTARAQQPVALSVFLDCRSGCDEDLIRTDITYVNWVRDRAVADVHVLVTSQESGAGGREYTVAFLGLRSFAGRGDTLVYNSNPTTTSDERRRGITRAISLGLVQFVAHTSAAQAIRISQSEEKSEGAGAQTPPGKDPWHAWVFEVGMNGSTSGERYYHNREVEANFTANRTTEQWKSIFESSYSYRNDRATVQEFDSLGQVISDETFRNLQRNWNAELLLVKSLSGHLSAGMQFQLRSNTFRNQKLNGQVVTALEYDLFPYKEATRRSLVFRYGLGLNAFRYADTTIFNKTRETLPLQMIEMNYAARQPWGQAFVSVQHNNFLNQASKRRTELDGSMNVRLFRGLSVNFGGYYNWIRDQLYIPKGGSDQVDVLLRRRALLTGFEYGMHFGVNYTFGSIFNNVVNPRF